MPRNDPCRGSSEVEFPGELQCTVANRCTRDLAERSRRRDAAGRIAEAWMIECVEELRAELESDRILYRKRLEQADVGIAQPRSIEGARTAATESSQCRCAEGIHIQQKTRSIAAGSL